MRLFRSVFLLLLFFLAGGCAKLPSPTAPVGGTASGKAICKTAQNTIGIPYRAGGTHPKAGFDCSGLVHWTFKQHGITMPRTAKEQMSVGKRISKDQARPGDLVFFKISPRRGYHSGIYTGDGKFIHSPRKGDTVREDTMGSGYWRPKLVTIRRVALKP